jgi:nuclear transport factor 2 (NTF2) superfamily protein
MYELGILDDGTLIGIPRSLMELSLKTLELMAAELGATVMVLRVINLTSPPPIDGRLGERIGENSRSVRRYRGRGSRGRGRGRGAGQREEPTEDTAPGPDDEQDDDEEDDYRTRVGNARAWTPRDGETIDEPYVSSARRRRDSALRKDNVRQANLRRKEPHGVEFPTEGEGSTGTSERNEEEKRMRRLSAKQRKQLTKRMIYDSVSPSEEEREYAKSMKAEENLDATMNQPLSDPVNPPKRTLEVDGRIYGPDEDWPVIIPQLSKPPLSANAADPSTSVPASWKERNLAQYALASDADGKWKAKREYGQAEKEMIRRERRERKRERKKSRDVENAEGFGSKGINTERANKDEEDGWGMFEMDRMGDESDERDDATCLEDMGALHALIADDKSLRQHAFNQHHNLGGSQPSSSSSLTRASPSPDPPKQHRSKRKMRQSDPRRQQRKESRRLDLLRGDGTNWVNPYVQSCEGPKAGALEGDLGEFSFDLGPTGGEDVGCGSASAMGGFGLGGGESSDEEGFDVRGVVSRMVRQSGAFDENQEHEDDEDEADSGFLDILASPGAADDRSYGIFPDNLATSPTKTIQALSPRPASFFALPSQQHSSACDLVPSPTDTITLPMDNLSLSFSHAEVCAQEDMIGGSSEESIADHARPEEEPRLCVEALVVKKIELEDRLYLDFSCLG